MNFPVLEFPDDPLDWPVWLEDRLLGSDLGDLVEQLTVVLDQATPEPTLEEICGESLTRVLQQGLSALNAEQVRKLVRSPLRLLDLQERILAEGGLYWIERIEAAEPEAADRRWQKLQPLLGLTPPAPVDSPSPPTRDNRRWVLLTAGSLAAAALVAVVIWRQQPAVTEPSGWNRPGVFTVELKGTQYLDHLAEAANEWFKRPRGTKAELDRELMSFRQSCQVLIQAPHPQLSEEQRAELIRRCKLWDGKLDGHLKDLRSGTKPVDLVRKEADATVNGLIKILHNNLQNAAIMFEGFPRKPTLSHHS